MWRCNRRNTATSAIASQSSQDAAQSAGLKSKIAELSASLQDRDEEVSRDRELLEHDRDIRDLMGSRDLLIADVSADVVQEQVQQKSRSEGFPYKAGKSLIFYAYDLDREPGVKNAGIFLSLGAAAVRTVSTLSILGSSTRTTPPRNVRL